MLKLRQRHQILLLHFHQFLHPKLILELIDTLGVHAVLDVEERSHGEIAPHIHTPILRDGEVELILLHIKAKLSVQVRLLLRFRLCFRFRLAVALFVHRLLPHRLATGILRQLRHIHIYGGAAFDGRHQRSDLHDDLSLLLRGHALREEQVCHPQHKVLFLDAGENVGVLKVCVRILLLLCDGYLLHRHREPLPHGRLPGFHHCLNARPETLTPFGRVGIRNEAQMRSRTMEEGIMLFCPCRTERSHRIMYADALQSHTIRCSLHEIECLMPYRFLPCRIDAEHRFGLVVYQTVLAVDILRLSVIVESPCRKSNDPLLAVAYGNGDTSAEEVIPTSVLQMQQLGYL